MTSLRCMAQGALLAAALLGSYGCGDEPRATATRPFLMGFTRWPADLTLDGFLAAQDFAHEHGDIVSVMFIGGIPWPEALAGKPFSKDVEDNLRYRPPAQAAFPFHFSAQPRPQRHRALPGAKDNLPLPEPWHGMTLDCPEVKKAYLAFTLRAVEAMKPDFLAIGIESNVLLSKNPAKWKLLKELHRETYAGIKRVYPALPVCFTTDVLHYRKLAGEARGSDQEGEVAELMHQSDLFAMSIYPHMTYGIPSPIPADFLDFALKFGKPVAVAESGMTSRNVDLKAFHLTLHGSEAAQQQFTDLLLTTAARDRYEFVINFATTDFERLCAKLPPPVHDLARIWAYTGMQTGDKKPKPALATWDAWFQAKYLPAR